MYGYVSNSGAKVDSKKVFYLSNRGGKNKTQLDFAAQVPLWAGSNQVTIIARENAEVKSVKTFYIFRGTPAATVAVPTPATAPAATIPAPMMPGSMKPTTPSSPRKTP